MTINSFPVIPLYKIGEYIECQSCHATYNMSVLDYNPERGSDEIEAEYYIVIKKVMIHMLLADGVIQDSEIEMLRKIYEEITTNHLSYEDARNEIKLIESSHEYFFNYLRELQGILNDAGKESVIKAAHNIALADGEFQEKEQTFIIKIGLHLGMKEAHVQKVLNIS